MGIQTRTCGWCGFGGFIGFVSNQQQVD